MKWRFNYKEWKERKYEWHRWFAWWPVEVDLVDHTWCWLSFVERQCIRDSECGDWWDYRESQQSMKYRSRYSSTDDRDWGSPLTKADWNAPKFRQPRQQILLPHEPIFSVFDPPEK